MPETGTLTLAFKQLSRNAAPRADCPAPGDLFDAAVGQAPGPRFEAAIEHVTTCGSCAESWRLAGEFERAAPLQASRLRPGSRLTLWVGLAAAALVVLVALPLVRINSTPPQSPAWRTGSQVSILPMIPEEATLPREAFVLRWSEPAAGARYSITVGTERLEPLASKDGLLKPEFQVPASALEPLPAGARVLWRVQATLPDGVLVSSPTFIARVP